MSITNELREWTRTHTVNCSDNRIALVAIAGRIDAEHESKVSYWQGASYKDGYDEGFASADDYFTDKRETLKEHGWVKLPVDADGVPIHVGDKMEFCAFDIEHPVIRTVDGIGKDVFFAWCGERGYQQHDAKRYRHYTPQTVEDVLLEACKAYHGLMVESMSDVAHDMPAPSEVIAEYAAKLRLAGEDE